MIIETFKSSQFSDCGSNALFLPSLKMIDSICHTHTTWTSLFQSLSSKILHSRRMISWNQLAWDHQCPSLYHHPYRRWHSSHCLSYCIRKRTSCCITDKWTAFHQCEFYDVNSNCLSVWTSCHNQHIRTAFRQCDFHDVGTIKLPLWLNFNLQLSLNVLSQSA